MTPCNACRSPYQHSIIFAQPDHYESLAMSSAMKPCPVRGYGQFANQPIWECEICGTHWGIYDPSSVLEQTVEDLAESIEEGAVRLVQEGSPAVGVGWLTAEQLEEAIRRRLIVRPR